MALLALDIEPGGAVLVTLTAFLTTLAVVVVVTVDTARAEEHLSRLIGPSRRIETDLGSLKSRLDVIDRVLSSETRRPWEPTALPHHYVTSTDPKPILLLPGADYHLPEIVAIAEELDRREIPNIVGVGEPHWARTGDGLIWYDRPVYRAPTPEDIPGNYSALLTMKDWAGYGRLVEAANEAGIPTFAKVEGAQDFHDVDTNRPRRPYRTARHILCQGQNDYEALEGMKRTIVGSTRLERLWWAPPASPGKTLALINLNFTYGVLTEARDLWLQTAVEGCELAGIPYVISVHPAEKARNPHPSATSISASRLLRHATVLISRFSTLPYEAMARGVPFIYHNPHGESVPSFQDPQGAFPVCASTKDLLDAISRTQPPGEDVRGDAARFFGSHISIERDRRSENRSVDALPIAS